MKIKTHPVQLRKKEHEGIYDFVNRVVPALASSDILPLLSEGHPLYEEASAQEVTRVKAFLIASFEKKGTPAMALPYILEELQNATHPYLIGAAARALRGLSNPEPYHINYLFTALKNLYHGDDYFSLDSVYPLLAPSNATSATKEIRKTLEWYANSSPLNRAEIKRLSEKQANKLDKALYADICSWVRIEGSLHSNVINDCCGTSYLIDNHSGVQPENNRRRLPDSIHAEDYKGETFSLSNHLSGHVNVVTFFYTRCDNPNKCSLTITRLGSLQRQCASDPAFKKVQFTAITYDQQFDHTFRLNNYCEQRQFKLGTKASAMRITDGMNELKDYLKLAVSYKSQIVSKHAIELYIMDGRGRVLKSFTRTQWDEAEVLNAIKAATSGRQIKYKFSNIARQSLSFLSTLGLALFPKCPLCLLGYMGALGITGMPAIYLGEWLLPVLLLAITINCWALWRRSRKRQFYYPFIFSCVGALLLIVGIYVLKSLVLIRILGVVCMCIAALLNSLDLHILRVFLKLFKVEIKRTPRAINNAQSERSSKSQVDPAF